MSLGIDTTTDNTEFKPYVKYDARAGRIFRAPKKDAGEQQAVDLTMNFSCLMDLKHINVGWLDFPTGAAPDYVVRDVSLGLPSKPANGKHKQGFVMSVMLAGDSQVYEMASSSKATVESFNILHDAYSAAPEAAAGKLPIVALAGTQVVETTGKNGTSRNYQPVWKIVGWYDRPAALPAVVNAGKAPAAPAGNPNATQATPPATGQTQWTAPAAATNPPSFG